MLPIEGHGCGATHIAWRQTRRSGRFGPVRDAEPASDDLSMGWLLPDAEGGGRPGLAPHLDALAEAMASSGPASDEVPAPGLPPIVTYFGQFLDHDMSALQGPGVRDVGGLRDDAEPMDRLDAERSIENARSGALDLDGLYGRVAESSTLEARLIEAMRDPDDAARMRLGPLAASSLRPRPPRPGVQFLPDGAPWPEGAPFDLPRLGDLLSSFDPPVRVEEVGEAGSALRGMLHKGQFRAAHAVIGDPRNDDHLIIAQLHVAFLRFHNAVADDLATGSSNAEHRFLAARCRVKRCYQWLVLNWWLPIICGSETVDRVLAEGAPLYTQLRKRVAPRGDVLPLPLEFSGAAFRFGHAMVRPSYDANAYFGTNEELDPADQRRLGLQHMFSLTGAGLMHRGEVSPLQPHRLPPIGVMDWSRLVRTDPKRRDRDARPIEPRLAASLRTADHPGGRGAPMRHLAWRNLRRGNRLGLPTAQAALKALRRFDAASAPDALTPWEIAGDGVIGDAVRAGGFETASPLWFYILREAELVGRGVRLGPLGGRIVAETIVGLLLSDPDSVLAAEHPPADRWHPDREPVAGRAIDDIEALLSVAGVLHVRQTPG